MPEGIRRRVDGTATALVPGSHAVVVMAKAPVSGAVKSRLVPPLTADEAAALNRCFIRDVCASIEAAAAIVAAAEAADVARASTSAAGSDPVLTDRNAQVVGLIAYTPAGAQAAFDGLVPSSFKFIVQRGRGLTARLTNVAADLFAEGYASVSLINSDSPTIPPAYIAEAVTHLARDGSDHLAQSGAREDDPLARAEDRLPRSAACLAHGDRPAQADDPLAAADRDGLANASDHLTRASDRLGNADERVARAGGNRLAIIGADDGGYCLIGLNRPHPCVFEGISWSTGEVLAQTLQRAAELCLIVLQTPSWYDIDDAASLRRLIRELSSEVPLILPGEPSKNVDFSENSPSISVSNHSPGRAALSQGRQSSQKSKNKRLQNKPNFFNPPATREWLAEALANGLAARLGIPPSLGSAGQPSSNRRGPDA